MSKYLKAIDTITQRFVLAILSGNIGYLFQSTLSMSGMKLPWLSYYMPNMKFIPQIIFEIPKIKRSCKLIDIANTVSSITRERNFPEKYAFLRIAKATMVHRLKP